MLATALVVAMAATAQPATPTCVVPDGTVVTLELALTDRDKQLGLMYRDMLPANRGMLFIFEENGIYGFWMKNTLIALDLIWLDATGKVVAVRDNAEPCRADPCRSYQPTAEARAVLEVNGGFAAAHGIVPGATLKFADVPGYPVAGPAK